MKRSMVEVDVKTISDDPHEETRRSAEGTPPDASAAPTRPPPPLYPPPAYPEPRIAVLSSPIIMIEELAPETPRVPPSESMVRLATPAHAMPPSPPRPAFMPPPPLGRRAPNTPPLPPSESVVERTDARSSLEAIIMTPGPMIPATLPPAPSKASSRRSWMLVAPCFAVIVGALVGFGFAQRAALPSPREASPREASPREASPRKATFAAARSIGFVRESTLTEPVLPPTMGRVVTRGAELGHRVYIDGRVAGTSGDTFTVPCGRHEVRIGTSARPRIVDVACGADVDVAR